MRYAIRRTQKQVEQERSKVVKVTPDDYRELTYRELQALATKRGINARQSTEALRKALA